MSRNRPYRGLLGAYPFGFRQSSSRVFRSYVLVSAIVGIYAVLLLLFGTISWIANPGLRGETAFLVVLGVLVLAPLVGPVLVVARRHRLEIARPGADRAVGLGGYAFLAGLYAGLLISDPSTHTASGVLGTALSVVDDVPDLYGLLPPAATAVSEYLLVRITRPTDRD